MTIHWKGLGKHFLMVPLVVRFIGVEISHLHTMTSRGEAKQYPDNPIVILLVQ
jgi:hypothetical protein